MSETLVSSDDWRAPPEVVAPSAVDDEHLGQACVHLVVDEGTAVWSARTLRQRGSARHAGDAVSDSEVLDAPFRAPCRPKGPSAASGRP
jgi:hypothetical protein